jgi:hypothetical protein
MKTIASVAIKHLESADKSLYAFDWAEKYRDTYRAWLEFRRQSGGLTVPLNEWRDSVSSTIKGMVEHYKQPENRANDRCYWSETFNYRVSITVMGGYRECPKWEVDIAVMVIDHSNKCRLTVA